MKRHLLLFALLLLISGAMWAQEPPTVTTLDVTVYDQTSATCGGTIDSYGGSSIIASYGVSYSTTDGFEGADGIEMLSDNLNSNNSFTVSIGDLTPATTYYVRAFAENEHGKTYAEQKSFTTLSEQTYSININVLPTDAAGSVNVSPSGPYHYNDLITLAATPSTGYTFSSWDVRDANNNPITVTNNQFTMPESNVTVTATFTQDTYTITTNVMPVDSAGIVNVNPSGPYHFGDQITLNAQANTGYTFSSWDVRDANNNSVNVTNNQFTMPSSDVTVTATFTQETYTITVTASPINGGTVTGGGSYVSGSTCTLHAVANSGYTFVKWTRNGTQVSTDPDYSFTVTGNASYVANFEQNVTYYTITATASPSNGGTVTGGGSYASGSTCTLHAVANSGYTFVKWTRNGTQVSTDPDYSFTVTGNASYVANFEQNVTYYTITATASPTNGGTVTGGGSYASGSTCTLHAVANSGYTFVKWTRNGTQVSTDPDYSFTVTGNASYVAHFQAQSYTITASANPSNGGTVSGGGTYNYGHSCTLTATAATGYTFLRWTENGNPVSTNASYTFTVTSNRTLIAQFQAQSFNITVSANPSEGGTVAGGGTYSYGQNCTVTATPNEGYTFVKWTKNNVQVSTNPSYTFTVTESAAYVAHFSLQQCTIKVSANPDEGGAVYIGDNPEQTQGTFTNGQRCMVHADANTGYSFVKWTENGVQVSINADYDFIVDSNRDLVAHFTQQEYIITAEADPVVGGTIEGTGGYDYGEECTLVATANDGYDFINWTKDGGQVSTRPNYTFNVTESATYVAHFQLKQFVITAVVDPENGGTVIGAGNYDYGQNCTLIAISTEGFAFVNWTKEDGEPVSANDSCQFTVTEDLTLVAHFSEQSYTITAIINPEGGGWVDGIGTHPHGERVTLKAIANPGYIFVNWEDENGIQISTNPTMVTIVTGDRTFVANFLGQQQNYSIQPLSDPAEGGIVTVSPDEATEGTPITITVNANTGYELDTITVYNTDDLSQTVQVMNYESNYVFTMPNYSVTVKAEFKQKALEIDTPAPICPDESLDLEEPVLPWFTHGYWQLSPTEDFDPENTITYTDQALDASYDGWSLRYHVQGLGQVWNSNVVHITVNSLAEMTMEGEESARLDQEVEYILVIEGQDNYPDYSFNWSVSDGQAEVTILNNSCKVIWKTTGTQQVSVTVTDETTGCTNLLVMEVNVTACIDNINEIVAKKHADNTGMYTLVLIYPNPAEAYDYQWLYSTEENGAYLNLDEGTDQYYYKGGALDNGWYKVRLTKKDDTSCKGETNPIMVNNSHRTIHIYPNPARQGNNIVIENSTEGSAQLIVSSIDGRVLHTQTLTDKQTTINLNLAIGIYVVRIIDSEGYTSVNKLIIQ